MAAQLGLEAQALTGARPGDFDLAGLAMREGAAGAWLTCGLLVQLARGGW